MSTVAPTPACRFCHRPLTRTVLDLGLSPLCESVVTPDRLEAPEAFFPLHVRVCDACLLVQLPEIVAPDEIFSTYAYFSSVSDSWVAHAERYVDAMVDRYGLGPADLVVEIASNDGYLLQHALARGLPVLGVEPAANVGAVARERGIRTLTRFFGAEVAREIVAEHGPASLVPANNVLAHVPDINDFVAGLAILVGERGVATLEFPHLLRTLQGNQFDQIYHEHYSYLSLLAVQRILAAHGLEAVDAEELPTHGGSLRVHARAAQTAPVGAGVHAVLDAERAYGLDSPEGYAGWAPRVQAAKRELVEFLFWAQREGHAVAGYGAPGKGNTLLNHCGVRGDLLPYTVDRNPYKQGTYLPGSRIPVLAPTELARTRPDFVLVLPWNLRAELTRQLAYVRDWGGRLVYPIPGIEIAEPVSASA